MIVETQDGVGLHVSRKGNGIPCLYLHGGPGYWSYSFEHFAGPLLENHLDMVYLDQRGCGRSNDSADEQYSLDRIILDLEDVRRSLQIEEWLVMGHSFGGLLAVNYAYRFPERVKGLMLSNCTVDLVDSFSHQIKKGAELLKENVQIPEETEGVLRMFGDIAQQLQDKDQYYTMQFGDVQHSLEKLEQVDQALAGDPAMQRSVFSREEYLMDFSSYTKYIDVPALVLAGEEDDAIGPEHHQRFQFPNQTTEILEGKHHPYIENQTSFQKAICSFISQIPTEVVHA